MDLGLGGKRAIIPAGSAGLGLACARALVAEGARVVICGRDAERVRGAAAGLGPGGTGVVADVSQPEGMARFVADAAEILGGVDVLVPNAGGPPPGTFASTTLADFEAALRLNLLSVVAACQEAVPAMRAQRFGRVVAITSVTVRQPIGNLIASTTARAGATGFLKTLATEVAADGVTVNSLQPGYHATDRVKAVAADGAEAIVDAIPARRMGDPEAFGRVAAFLCSEHASYITGAAIPVDGGASGGLQ